MTIVVVLLLALWGTLLVSWLRSRSAGSFGDSVGTFRRHLSVLERAAPGTVRPANRLRGSGGIGIPPYRSFAATGGVARRVSQPGRPGVAGPAGWSSSPHARSAVSSSTVQRRQAQRRRRDVLVTLLAAMFVSLVLVVLTGARALLYAQILFDLLGVGYVALLVHMRNLATERELKVTYMPQTRPGRPGGAGVGKGRPPAYAPADVGYDTGASGYGQLALRRAVN